MKDQSANENWRFSYQKIQNYCQQKIDHIQYRFSLLPSGINLSIH